MAGRPLTTPVVDRAPAMIELVSRPAADLDAVSGLSREPGAGRLEGPPETSQEPLLAIAAALPAGSANRSSPACTSSWVQTANSRRRVHWKAGTSQRHMSSRASLSAITPTLACAQAGALTGWAGTM